MNTTAEVTTEIVDGVAIVRMCAEERRNALSVAMAGQLVAAFDSVDDDPDVGALVLTGGAHFCAGAVREVLGGAGADPAQADKFQAVGAVYRCFARIESMKVPTIAAIRGAAVGAGLNLALATDLRIMSESAKLIPGFDKVGIHPGGGHITLLRRQGGRETAAALALFGERLAADRAVELGLVWTSVADDQVEEHAFALASRAAADPELTRRVLETYRLETAGPLLPWPAAIEIERAAQMWSLRRKHDREEASGA
jgi:enoyl-CoA hydratase